MMNLKEFRALDSRKSSMGRMNPLFQLLFSVNHRMVPTTLTFGWLHSVIYKFMQSGARWDLVVKLLTVLRMSC